MIAALVGRRIDAPDARPERFPLRNVALVRPRLQDLFAQQPGRTLVCSAACGADLLALEAAGALGWKRRVVLPFSRERFRETSVTDRPGDWSALYDRILNEVEKAGDLLMHPPPPGKEPYAFANRAILEEMESAASASGEDRVAIVVWDGKSRGPDDLTAAFGKAARQRGLTVIEVSTLE